MKLFDLMQEKRTIDVTYQDHVIPVTYRVNAVTPEFLAKNPDAVTQIKELVAEWEILDENEQPISPVKIADQLPVQFLNAVLEAILNDMRVGEAEKKG